MHHEANKRWKEDYSREGPTVIATKWTQATMFVSSPLFINAQQYYD